MSGAANRRPPGAELGPTRTLAAGYDDFDERTEIAGAEPGAADEDEFTLRGDMLLESGFVDAPEAVDPTRIPPPPGPAPRGDTPPPRRKPPILAFAIITMLGGGLGVLAAMWLG